MLFWGTNALYSIGCGSLKFPVSVYLYEFSATVLTSSLASCISLYEHNGFKTEIGRCKNNQFAVSPSFRAGSFYYYVMWLLMRAAPRDFFTALRSSITRDLGWDKLYMRLDRCEDPVDSTLVCGVFQEVTGQRPDLVWLVQSAKAKSVETLVSKHA